MPKVQISYGTDGYTLDTGPHPFSSFRPAYPPAVEREDAAFTVSVRDPIGGGPPLNQRIGSNERLAVVMPDITRALPGERLLRWLFDELAHVPAGNIVIISGTGTHRKNRPEEWIQMVGEDIYRRYRCVDHVCDDDQILVHVGESEFGYPVAYNRDYVEADRRILLGFIEPHFMAGFSGGYKAVFPGVTDIDAIMNYHSARNIAHPRSTWGILDGNPTQENIRAGGSLLPVDFCINVTLNDRHQITRFFCGDVIPAHDAGCAFCKETAMVAVEQPFDVVVTSNSGYPLDQNLYQCVKGMSAASQIVREGGLIILAGRCNDGFPDHGNFRKMLNEHRSHKELLETIHHPGFHCRDQWQVQILANILCKARIAVYSEMDPGDIRLAHMQPVDDLNAYLKQILSSYSGNCRLAVLPEGPMTIPYLSL